MNTRCTVASTIAAVMVAPTLAADPGFWFTGVAPGSTFSVANGLSADGRIVSGYSGSAGFPRRVGFSWTASGGRQDFGLTGPNTDVVARGISADGRVIVGDYQADGSTFSGFRRVDGGPLESLGPVRDFGGWMQPQSASADGGVIVGASQGFIPGAPDHENEPLMAFRWTAADGALPLGQLGPNGFASSARDVSSDGSVVVGYAQAFNEFGPLTAFRWDGSSGMQELPNHPSYPLGQSSAAAISADGRFIAGSQSGPSQPTTPVRWDGVSVPLDLGLLPGWILGTAMDITPDGRTIVGQGGIAARTDAFLWREDAGMVVLQDHLLSFGVDVPNGWFLSHCTAVSADGSTFAGWAQSNSGGLQGWVGSVPHPSALVALVMNCGAAVVLRRRSK